MTVPSSQQCPYEGQSYELHQSQTTAGGVKMVAGYALQERLGSGSFATVYKGVKILDTNGRTETVAIKAISRNSDKITKKVLENLDLEISILTTYRHPNIVCLTEVSKTDRHFYLVLEYCAGGDVQRLIRSRKSGRLTERLSRRLMRDLTAGLKFLWGQELIHRDIKPQNLLLTGPLPLDELHDPSKSDSDEIERRKANFCTNSFHLKIADFGFARHLQTTSMADTLCGSPLYMAPEILQHKRYDAKADLWSAGTVLFEMISGRPPFNGQNHIDLLHNIQQKSVRLPKDVKVSSEGVKLLRLLLDRDPISRASFTNFVKASDDFVACGCNGTPATETLDTKGEASISYQHKTMAANLGPISEVEESSTLGPATMDCSAVKGSNQQGQQESYHMQNSLSSTNPQHHNACIPMSGHRQGSRSPTMVSPSLDPTIAPPTPVREYAPVVVRGHEASYQYNMGVRQYSHFSPLEASPPGPSYMPNANIPPPLTLGTNASSSLSHTNGNQRQMQLGEDHQSVLRNMQHQQDHPYRRVDSSQHTDDSGFVMVEHGAVRNNASTSPTSMRIDEEKPNCQQDQCYSHSPSLLWKQPSSRRGSLTPTNSPPSTTPRYVKRKNPISTRNFIPPGTPFIKKGMLSTSPGTGGALVGMMGSQPCEKFYKTGRGNAPGSTQSDSSARSDVLAKMLAAAEDVGRRAVNVAHVGDTRAYLAMKIIMSNDSDSSLPSGTTPMEGVEEEYDEVGGEVFGYPEGASSAYLSSRTRCVSIDRSLSKQVKSNMKDDDDEDDEMPFAMASASSDSNLSPPAIIGRTNNSDSSKNLPSTTRVAGNNFHPTLTQAHFREALKCYLKALSMLKGSVHASQRVTKELQSLTSSLTNHNTSFVHLVSRCDISRTWLTGQFKGVLERADAANTEILKIEANHSSSDETNIDKKEVLSVEELVYNHSLACGRDGAVKQLLGQYDAARSCYRSAGLLAETLLMEEKLGEEDRKVVEEYVQGFLDRITEVDAMMLQQSKHGINSGSTGTSTGPLGRRGSGVVGLVGTAAAPSGH